MRRLSCVRHRQPMLSNLLGNSNSAFLKAPANATIDETYHGNLSTIALVIKLAPWTLLALNPYRPEEEEQVNEDCNYQRRLYRWEDLMNIIQASDEELKAVEISGCWRVVEKLMGQILTLLVHNLVLYEWSLTALKEDEVVATLRADGFSRVLAFHCLETYGIKGERADESV
ncbi:uncharacterized protein [Aristolochia californica]|uniref:uncharacterized protein n=1 Tax=Aristolochia californica TaxID=171875 RepID=UPI0035DB2B3C